MLRRPAFHRIPLFLRDRIISHALVVLLGAAALAVQGQELSLTPDQGRTTYQPGDKARWQVEVKGSDVTQVAYTLKQGGLTEVTKGTIPLTGGKGQVEAVLKEPGWFLVEATIPTTNQPIKALGGALVSPEKFAPAQPRPDDFDAFWDGQIKALAAVPSAPELTRVDLGKPNLDYFKLTMDHLNGWHIRGQLARPSQGEKFPAMLIVQWAGVYPLQRDWVTGRAAEGWLVLDINAHDLPIDESEAFYKAQSEGPLKDYPSIGNDKRETSYFLRMYLSCYRAAQYLAERPDWDGQTLVVTGGSQGGLQAILTAAIHPKVSAVLAIVPAGCDVNGPVAGRMPGWPMWYYHVNGRNDEAVRGAARYYDVVNFAPRVRCPVLVAVGLIDTVCPPPGILTACNLMQGSKEIVILPVAEHGDKQGSHAPYYARFNAWNQALVHGKPAPVQ
jgi:cephalosporin-C deacetylase-like acetyl esterase